MRLGRALATTLGCLLFLASVGVATAETLPEHWVSPGAIEPPPVNPAIEAEAQAHANERRARGVAARWQDAAEVELYPALQGGWVGWCLGVYNSAHDGTSCPVAPQQAYVAYERWEPGTGGTQGLVLAATTVEDVAVDQGAIVPLSPVPGFSRTLAAAVVTIPAPFPWSWSDEFEPVTNGITNSPTRGVSAPAFAPAVQLPAMSWQAPQAPPSGACSLSLHRLPGAKAHSGHVVASVPAAPGIVGGGFTSCADTEFSYQGSSLDAAVLLGAANPGGSPPPLPRAVHDHRGLFTALAGWVRSSLSASGVRGLQSKEVAGRVSASACSGIWRYGASGRNERWGTAVGSRWP